jgi:hypothetical protein
MGIPERRDIDGRVKRGRGGSASAGMVAEPPRKGDAEMRRLRGSALAADGEFADLVQEDRLLGGVEMLRMLRNLGKERIGDQHRRLVLVACACIAQKDGDVHLQRTRQTVERGERRHRLAVLNLGDIGAGNAHSPGELPLREIAHATQIAHSRCYLYATLRCGSGWNKSQRSGHGLRLLHLKRSAAAPACARGAAELNETAAVTTKDLSLFNGCHHSCHKLYNAGGSQSGHRSTSPITGM